MKDQTISTRQKLLDIARQLMMSKGYNATTVEEVCKLAGVTKGAFFYYFKTKEDLGVSVLNAYWETRQRQFSESDWLAQEQPLAQLAGFLNTVADVFMHDADGFSCLAGSFTQELAATQPLFRDQVAALFAEWAQQIKPVLQAAQEHAGVAVDVDALADYIIAVVEGALILAQARQDRQVIARQLQMLISHLNIVFAG